MKKIVLTYQFHPSILIIKNEITNTNTFRFEQVMMSDIKNEIKGLNPTKATAHNNIISKILRQSVLSLVSSTFERSMQKQINDHIKNELYLYSCGYRKGFSMQHALLSLIERWKNILDGGPVLMDLPKAFDTLNHELLIAKFSAYGFNNESLKLIQFHLTNRQKRTKINKSFSK